MPHRDPDTDVTALTRMSRQPAWRVMSLPRLWSAQRAGERGVAGDMARGLLIVCVAVAPAGCILSPPIEDAEVDQNYPPFLVSEAMTPPDEVYVARDSDSASITFSVDRFYDPDPEDRLYYAWYSPTPGLGILENETRPRTQQEATSFGIAYAFEGTSFSLNPCQDLLTGSQSISLWLYVTDRPWASTGTNGVEPDRDAGAFMTSWTWIIDRSNLICE